MELSRAVMAGACHGCHPAPYTRRRFVERNLQRGVAAGSPTSTIGSHTYAESRACQPRRQRAVALGLRPNSVSVALHDSSTFAVFLGHQRGYLPCVNTLLTANDYRYILGDSRASALVVSPPLLPAFEQAMADGGRAQLREIIVAGEAKPPYRRLDALLSEASDTLPPSPTTGDDACFWLYSSGRRAPRGR